MKVLALIILCAFAAVQARSTAVQHVRTEAAAGDAPWVVHLRIAVITSGLLNTCAGSLVHESWILSSASCVVNVRFIWARYGTIYVFNPELVTESSASRINDEGNLALLGINRVVHSTANIGYAKLATPESTLPDSATFCGFGASADGSAPGENLSCYTFAIEAEGGLISAQSEDGAATPFDDGAALVSDGVLYGVLVTPAEGDSAGTFLPVAPQLEWIEQVIGASLRN